MEHLRNAWRPDWRFWVSDSVFEALREQYLPELPPIEGGEGLVAILMEIGPTLAAGQGDGPVTFGEIAAWCALTGVRLQPWEARFVCRLSREYLTEAFKARKADAPEPWLAPGDKPRLTSTQRAVRVLAGL